VRELTFANRLSKHFLGDDLGAIDPLPTSVAGGGGLPRRSDLDVWVFNLSQVECSTCHELNNVGIQLVTS